MRVYRIFVTDPPSLVRHLYIVTAESKEEAVHTFKSEYASVINRTSEIECEVYPWRTYFVGTDKA